MALFVSMLLCCHQARALVRASSAAPFTRHPTKRLLVSRAENAAEQFIVRRRVAKSSKGSSGGSKTNQGDKNARPLTAIGLQMTLTGMAAPLDAYSRMTWQDTTRDFVEADIWNTAKEQGIKSLEVDVYFDRQDPPLQPQDSSSRRLLPPSTSTKKRSNGLWMKRSSSQWNLRWLQEEEQELDIIFDVYMLIESKQDTTNLNAMSLVMNAFNSEQKRAAYVEQLRLSGDESFASVSMNGNLVSTSAPATIDGKKIGIIVGITIVVLVLFGCVVFVLHGNRTNAAMATQVVPEEDGEDGHRTRQQRQEKNESLPQQDEPTTDDDDDQSSDGSASNRGVPRTIVVDTDNESQYFGGNVSVAWSMDTESHPTTINSNSLVL